MEYTAAVITVSDRSYRGERPDGSGPAVARLLEEHGYTVRNRMLVPDEAAEIKNALITCADTDGIALIITTGGTGFSPRDITPEATLEVIGRQTPGIPEYMRMKSMEITERGCLSRSVAGIRGTSLIVNLPGSPKAAIENLSAVLSAIGHGLKMLNGEHDG
ncbi:MAG: MogA/MoaB family molybdenum cofactor biosynthesis protein [Lachnospiraceae bacterium]|nr:MogA/MoaB family molybdenum cofactor biosynthesis protein [Lachnospiraceae bacterium]